MSFFFGPGRHSPSRPTRAAALLGAGLLLAAAHGPRAESPGTENTSGPALQQIVCPVDACERLSYNPTTFEEQIDALLDKRAARILVAFDHAPPRTRDAAFEPVSPYLAAIARRGGRVSVEPVYVRERGTLDLPLIGDILSVGYDLITRLHESIAYDDLEQYHAKVLTHPASGRVLFVYFAHRSLGDICATLYSSCDTIAYSDEDTFDLTLSQQLAQAASAGRSVRVDFSGHTAVLPAATIDLDTLSSMRDSARLYKWLIAAKQTQKIAAARPGERFLPLATVVAVVKYSLKVYDLIQAARLYAPAREMRAEVVYEDTHSSGGGKILGVVFSPLQP